jgi:hypothetical protein
MDARLDRVIELLEDSDDDTTVGTSVRLPTKLRDAAALAAEMGITGSTTELTIQGLRDWLEAHVQRMILDAHYKEYPEARPTLAEIALVAAEMDGDPLAQQPELIQRAADEILAIKRFPDPDDVLLYAAGLASGLAAS